MRTILALQYVGRPGAPGVALAALKQGIGVRTLIVAQQGDASVGNSGINNFLVKRMVLLVAKRASSALHYAVRRSFPRMPFLASKFSSGLGMYVFTQQGNSSIRQPLTHSFFRKSHLLGEGNSSALWAAFTGQNVVWPCFPGVAAAAFESRLDCLSHILVEHDNAAIR